MPFLTSPRRDANGTDPRSRTMLKFLRCFEVENGEEPSVSKRNHLLLFIAKEQDQTSLSLLLLLRDPHTQKIFGDNGFEMSI